MLNAVNYILENDATIQGLVGEDSSTEQHKIYPVVSFQGESEPYIITSVVGRQRLGKDCSWTYQINVSSYAKSYDDVTVLNEAVIEALEGHAPGVVNGYDIATPSFMNEADGFDKDRICYVKNAVFEIIGDPVQF